MERGDCDEELNSLLGEISNVTIVTVPSPGESFGDGPSKQLISSNSPGDGSEVGDGISLPFDLPSVEYLTSEFNGMSLNGTSQLLNANGSICEENTSSSSLSSFNPSDMPGSSTRRPNSVAGDHQCWQGYQGSSASMYLNGGANNFFEPEQTYQGSLDYMHLHGGTNNFFKSRLRYQGSSPSTCLHRGTNNFFEPKLRYQGSSTSTFLNGGTNSFFEPRLSVSAQEFEFPSLSWQQQHHHLMNAPCPGYVPYRQQHQLDDQSWLLEYERYYRNYSQLLQNQSLGGHVIGRGNPGLQLDSHMTIPQQQQARQVNSFNLEGNIANRMYNPFHPSSQSNNLGGGLYENSGLSMRNVSIERPASIDSIIQKLHNFEMVPDGLPFNEENQQFIDQVFTNVISDVFMLMTNSSGHHLVEKLVEICSEEQLTLIVREISKNSSRFLKLACDRLGTHVVKKIISTVRTSQQYYLISSSLKYYLLPLIKDNNGVSVVELCIQCLPPPYRESFLGPAVVHCVELAKEKRGCCFLQKYIDVLDGNQKIKLLSVIAAKACELSQDPYGNYLVQFILEKDIPWAISSILDQLQGHYRALSLQKHGSNVVEKCLFVAGVDAKTKIVKELIKDPYLPEIAQDQYGNYVIQSAFEACNEDGALRAAMLKAIKAHIPQLGSNHYGKKVLQCIKHRRK